VHFVQSPEGFFDEDDIGICRSEANSGASEVFVQMTYIMFYADSSGAGEGGFALQSCLNGTRFNFGVDKSLEKEKDNKKYGERS
jgi:hypothetical protein